MKISIAYYSEEEAEAMEVLEVLKNLKPTARVKRSETCEKIHHAFVTTPRLDTSREERNKG